MKTTLFDLNQTAATAALAALGKDALAQDAEAQAAFTAAGHDRLDYPKWKAMFVQHVDNYTSLKTQSAPSAVKPIEPPAPAAA